MHALFLPIVEWVYLHDERNLATITKNNNSALYAGARKLKSNSSCLLVRLQLNPTHKNNIIVAETDAGSVVINCSDIKEEEKKWLKAHGINKCSVCLGVVFPLFVVARYASNQQT